MSDQHLFSEHREIKRIPNKILYDFYDLSSFPDTFRLGPGHEKFFVNKLGFLYDRAVLIEEELERRNISHTSYLLAYRNAALYRPDLFRYWHPSEEDIDLSRSRIRERLRDNPGFHTWSNGEKWQTSL